MPPTKPGVLVTGATRGIGLATAEELARTGWQVFAGIRRPDALSTPLADLVAQHPGAVVPVAVDLTDPASHRAAAATIAEYRGPAGLDGLVNNAGSTVSAPLEFLPLEELRAQLEVNLVGQLGVTQSLLPQLRAARGRIVTVSSIGGLVAGPILGAYHVSKYGIEAMSDSLRRELRHLGVSVSLVEPATVRTDIWETGSQQADVLATSMPPEATDLYGHLVERMREFAGGANERGVGPEVVAGVIARALTERRPRDRYLVGREARISWLASRVLPVRMLDRFLAPDPAERRPVRAPSPA